MRDTLFITLKAKEIPPLLFLQKLIKTSENDFRGIKIVYDFPDGWVTHADVDSLIKLVRSKTRCKCFMIPLAMYMPFKENTNLGGYAIEFIKSYKEKRRVNFAQNTCPEINEEDAANLISWWSEVNKLIFQPRFNVIRADRSNAQGFLLLFFSFPVDMPKIVRFTIN